MGTTLPTKIFNAEKKNHEKPEIILGEDVGFFDTINKSYPDIWRLYKTQKALDWDENEFDYSECLPQFKAADKNTYDMMIKTLAWQWEADSIASKIFIETLAQVCTSSEAWAGWQKISEIEVLHSACYSEIVRNSFDDPSDILEELLRVQEAQDRLVVVGEVFAEAREWALKYGLGQIPNNQDLYDKIYLFIVAIFLMERVQFMASFAVTFAIADGTGLFMTAAKGIQRICADEFEVHVQFCKAILRELNKTERGKQAFINTKSKVIELINEVVASEAEWTDYAFSEGRELVGVTNQMMKDWVYFSATDVAKFMGLEKEVEFPIIDKNPLKYMEDWIDMNSVQASNQEEDTGQYKVNLLKRDDEDETFDIDF